MKLLAIDTSTVYLNLAIIDGERILAKFRRKAPMSHSSLLVPMIDKLLKKARMKLKDIDGFCVSIGPGSFTGLRIGVTTVKGLAYSLKKPVVTVPTLDAIARNAKEFIGVVAPVLDARKNKVYACFYDSDGKDFKRISEYLLLPLKDLMQKAGGYDKVLFLGDAVESKIPWHPRPEVVARLGAEYFRKKRFTSPEDLEPMYLYSKECDITGK